MRKGLYTLICMALAMVACDVHEWPELKDSVEFHLRLQYETDMTEWTHAYDGSDIMELGYGQTYDNHLKDGRIRYIIRAYPLAKRRTASVHTQEITLTKAIVKGYDHEVDIALPPGDYNIMVWSDLVENEGDVPFHNTSDFSEIRLQGAHIGNTDYRDAFKGCSSLSLKADIVERQPDTLDIRMERPSAKFEFITNDVVEFIDKEVTRLAAKSGGENPAEGTPTKVINLEDYKIVFYYVGFMPDTYSLFTDKPVDSSTGVMFRSTLRKLSESEATMGFDYALSYSTESAVSVQLGIYDNEGTLLSMTDPLNIPLQRSHHTILTGTFLMSETSGGVNIDPEYDGDINLIFP